ncbi:MAG: tRNA (N(6)-L-threonylcarbamoyladenosine(37)-C(2))-methylthiotransferase MtaB [Clostridium sp.]|nr:tRNA (N(6)-L-threonylcarbamoyladenosine(37)-C(2))-methylthiotransferase MtaB [Clostridium sp.]MCM1399405.1 tRNA (N(6)-L-threonylcarbamoyladenosine(37)-C(2))-methylthiotransferase MtaB [Clostridium sp.]MCM1459959.1 tRNA (N(6)-L-threonylcarbamoyladenosine(37)-C(2))-methylthiotransferase MtaB [Bacteroides sp.]
MFVNIKEKRVAIYTLGCKVNQYESDSMMNMLEAEGAHVVSFDDKADIYIINTCSVTNMAERKSRQIIHRAKKKNKDAIIVAAGCYVQAEEAGLRQDEAIDIIVGNNKKGNIAEILDAFIETHSISDTVIDINKTDEYEDMVLVKPNEHCRAYVKIQDGCNNFCSYCIIPYTRGRTRSRKKEEIVAEVKRVVASGVKEVVLTGINLSSYTDENGSTLLELLKALCNIPGLYRIRMGSLEPRVITEPFLEEISRQDKICPHFHLSLQSACNETLKRMNRKYTIEEYGEKCNLIRKYYDRPAITTDIIVGFPGETVEEFNTTRNNLERLNLYEMHIFKYSKRKGTVAYSMPNQVSDQDKEERSNILINMAKRHKEAYESTFQGNRLKVLVEEYVEENGIYYMKGHTERYILVKKEADERICRANINNILEVTY